MFNLDCRHSLRSAWRAAVLLLALLFQMDAARALDPARVLTEYQHTAFTEREGAPARIRRIDQTRDGYLWLGTVDGFYKFDGFSFEPVRALGGETLPRQGATGFLQESDGGMWLGFAGAGLMHYIDGHLIRYKTDAALYVAAAITRAPDGTLWLLHNNKLAYLSGDHIIDVGTNSAWGILPGVVNGIWLDSEGTLWLSTYAKQHDVYYLRKGARQFAKAPLPFEGETLATSHDGMAWGCGGGGLTVVTRAGADMKARSISAEPCGELLVDANRGLWIQQSEGIRHFGDADSLSTAPPAKRGPPDVMKKVQGLTSNEATAIFEDREGNVWVGTNAGLDRFKNTTFVSVPSTGREVAYAMADAGDGGVWSAKLSSRLTWTDGKSSREITKAEMDTRTIRAIYPARDGSLYVAGVGIFHSSDGKKFVELPHPGHEVTAMFIRAMTVDADGALWVTGGEAGRVARFFDGKWTEPAGEHGFPRQWNSRAMLTDTKGRTWFSFLDRILLLEHGEARLLDNTSNDLAVGWIMAIYEANDHLWVAGVNGVAWFDGQRFHTLKGRDGASFALLCGIVETPAGELWLHGLDSVWRIRASEVEHAMRDPKANVDAQRFDSSDGLHGVSTIGDPLPNLVRGSDGRLWFSTSSGLAWLDPAKVSVVSRAPTVLVRAVRVDDRPFEVSASNIFPDRNKRVEIDYTAVSPGLAERIRFRYKLEGVDADWHDAENLRRASYNDLPPGNYRFKVASTDDQGAWNGTEASFSFEVAPAWFQTSWFRLLVVAATASMLISLYRIRVRRLASAFRMEAHVQQAERERIAGDLHDTLLQSMQSLVWRVQRLARHLSEQDPARSDLAEALEGADRAITEGREHVFGLRQRVPDDVDILDALRDLGERHGRDWNIAFHCRVDDETRVLRATVSAATLRILSEALANAFHHARAANVSLHVRFGSNAFEAQVIDDGQGMDATLLRDGKAGHLGLVVMNERAASMGARLRIDSKVGAGTTVTLRISARRAYESTSRRAWWHRRRRVS